MRNDIELHGLIARAADNAVLSRLLESVASMGIAKPAPQPAAWRRCARRARRII